MKSRYMIGLAIAFSMLLAGCSSPVASPTPLPTGTPTEIPLPTNTPMPTETALPTSAPSAGCLSTASSPIQLEKQADGSWMFCDYEAGFQFQAGKNWYLEDVSALDLMGIMDRASKITAKLGIKNAPQILVEPQGMRVLGIYTDESLPDYMMSGFNAAYVVDEGFAQMPLENMQKRVIEILAQSYGLDTKAFDTALAKNDLGTEYGVVRFNLALNYYQMRIFFKLDKGMGMITFGYSDKNSDTFEPDWTLLTGSLKYTNP